MKKKGSFFALAIAICGIGAMFAIGAYQYFNAEQDFHANLVAGIVVLYTVWILSEFRVTVGETNKDANDDKGTCETYAIGRFITMLTAFAFQPIWNEPGAWLYIGFALFLSGIVFRTYAIHTLGKFYSHRVRTPNANTIIENGPYRFLRHPAYAGMLLAHVGILVLFFNWFLLVAFIGVFIPVLVRRIRVEESHLMVIPEYRQFALHRARVAPGIW